MSRLILVTGGLGFIGRHLVALLRARGEAVRVFDLAAPDTPADRPPEDLPPDDLPGSVEYVRGTIEDFDAVRQAVRGAERVYHLAAKAGLWAPDKSEFERVNLRGARNVFRAAEEAGVERVVHTSTESILKSYRRRPPPGIGDEDVRWTLADMPGPYCRGKLLAENEAFAAAARGVPVVIVNPTVPVGPGDVNLTPPARMLLGFLNGKYPAYLESTLNLVDVRDVAAGHLLAAERGAPGRRYVLGGINIAMSELLERLATLTGLAMPRRRIPYWVAWLAAVTGELAADHLTHRPPAAPLIGVRLARLSLRFDNTRARTELGATFRPLDVSLRDAIRWYAERGLLTRTPKLGEPA